jgi:hypothetical protein
MCPLLINLFIYITISNYIYFFSFIPYIGKSKKVGMSSYSLNIQEYGDILRLIVHEEVFYIIKTVIILTKFHRI